MICLIPLSVIAFLEMDSSIKFVSFAMCCKQLSPKLLFRMSSTFKSFKLWMFYNPSALKQLAFSCNFLTFIRWLAIVLTPTFPILFSPKIKDLSPLKLYSCWISSSVKDWFGISISSVSSVTVVFWRVTSSTGFEFLICEPAAGFSRSI